MNDELKDQIRRYAQAVDEKAAPIEELVPPGLADELGGDRPTVQISVPLRPRPPRREVPGWVIGLAAAVAVLVIALPLWISLTRSDDDVVDTVATTTPVTPTTAAPGLIEPSLTFDRTTGQMSGTAWPAGATVTATMGDIETEADVGSDGSFLMGPANIFECCFNTMVVTDGEATITLDSIPDVSVMRVDPERDVVSGSADGDDDVRLRIVGASDEFTTTVSSVDGGWFVDLTGQFDLLPGMVVEAKVDYPDITVIHSSSERIAPGMGLRLGSNELTGDSLAPLTDVSVSIDASPLGDEVATDARGQFTVDLEEYGLDLAPGTTVSISDGISRIDASVPFLTYDMFDPAEGLAAGVTDLPDGSELYLELWMTDGRSEEPNQYITYNSVVSNGVWEVRFDPIPAGWTVLVTDVGGVVDAFTTVEFQVVIE